MKERKRNGLIEFLRFVACLSIAVFHYEWIYIGHTIYLPHFYIFVEFFFIISGFFLALEATKGKKSIYNGNGVKYAFNQLKKLYTLYIIAFLIIFFLNNNISKWIINLWNAKWEILLLNTFNFSNNLVYNQGGAPYFISSLLVASCILFYIINKNKDLFKNIIGPLIIICGLGYLINTYGNLSQWQTYNLFISSGLIRALADISVGAWFYIVVLPHLQNIKKYYIIPFYIIFVLAFIALIVLKSYISFSDLIIYIPIFGLITCVCYSTNVNDKLNKVLCSLGSISYPVFLFHYIILFLMKKYVPHYGYLHGIIIYILILIPITYIIVLIKKKISSKIIKKENK